MKVVIKGLLWFNLKCMRFIFNSHPVNGSFSHDFSSKYGISFKPKYTLEYSKPSEETARDGS